MIWPHLHKSSPKGKLQEGVLFMSYRILYNSVFLKSKLGITPVVLSGDNNVYDTDFRGRSVRRSRDWSCFMNCIAQPKDKLLEIAHSFDQDEEVWRRHNQLVTGAGIVRWMQTGIRTAMTVEEVLAVNKEPTMICYVSRWEADSSIVPKRECQKIVQTTAEFDAWIEEARQFTADHTDGNNFYVVKFWKEDIRKTEIISGTNKVVIKSPHGYLSARTAIGYHWNESIHAALKLTQEEAETLIENEPSWRNNVRIQKFGNRSSHYNAIIRVHRKNGQTDIIDEEKHLMCWNIDAGIADEIFQYGIFAELVFG